MSYREDERKKAIQLRENVLRDPGDGIFLKKKRDFVLQEAVLNLWAGIREDAIDYFQRNNIPWWMGDSSDEPTGHLLSSQVACINHLYFARQRQDIALSILKSISEDIQEAMIVDNGYVDFEIIGKENYLNERSHTRGANSTSVDAVMVGKKRNGKNLLIFIEWKYTEEYKEESKYIPERYSIYNQLLEKTDCPIQIAKEKYQDLYYEPFYQMMRQTLLGWKMVEHQEYQCDEYLHVHIIPEKNRELRERITSPGLCGDNINDISTAWKRVLKESQRYTVLSPSQLLKSVELCADTKSILTYLQERYW